MHWCFYNESLYLSHADCWLSADLGISWTLQTSAAAFGARSCSGAVVLGNRILLCGGDNLGGFTNDCWISADLGVTWTQQTAAALWSPRLRFGMVATGSGASAVVLLCGGYHGVVFNDCYKSSNQGVTWTLQTANPGWTIVGFYAMAALESNVVICKNECKVSSDDGVTWSVATPTRPWQDEFVLKATVVDNSLLLFTPTEVWIAHVSTTVVAPTTSLAQPSESSSVAPTTSVTTTFPSTTTASPSTTTKAVAGPCLNLSWCSVLNL